MNWTIGKDRFQLFSFLGGFLPVMTELLVANSGNQKILSTNWPHDSAVNPFVETVSISQLLVE